MRSALIKLSLVPFLALALAACSSAEGDAVDEDGDEGALSEATCNTRAENVQNAHLATCETNHKKAIADANACRQNANAPYEQFLAQLEAARQRVQILSNEQVTACIQNVQRRDCATLVPQFAGALTSSDLGLRNAAENACSVARRGELNRCNDAAQLAERESSAAQAYEELRGQQASKYVEWKWALVKCWFGDSADSSYASCKNDKTPYKTEFSKCRRICADAPGAACVPEAYSPKAISCGEIAKSTFGGSCDCVRSKVCDEYDKLVREKDGKLCSIQGEAEDRMWIVKVGADKATGKPTVRADCTPVSQVVMF